VPKSSKKYLTLSQKWQKRHKVINERLWTRHKDALDWIGEKLPAKEKLASGAVGALMLANALPGTTAAAAASVSSESSSPKEVVAQNKTPEFALNLKAVLPDKMRSLTSAEEEAVGQLLSEQFKMKVSATLDGKRLNRSYGYIGAEQHLARYPGDGMGGHLGTDPNKNRLFYSSGMAPGLGAWGYFAPSASQFTSKDSEREKWYIAVQTFDAPGYLENTREMSQFFKYRKMLVVNPQTGQAVVADIADAGPADWTGKHLGGSPEVMAYLGLQHGMRKGAVVYYFIDDPDDTIPLGPI